jgi:2-haloacid dehalogenase
MNFDDFGVLTFDCYGTLIDWESGIISAIQPVLSDHNISLHEDQELGLYAMLESEAERGEYLEYKAVLRKVMQGLGHKLGFTPSQDEQECFVRSIKDWPPFPDSVRALQDLKEKYRLAILSNVDDDLFALSTRHLQVDFDWVITAEQARSYKPSLRNFRLAIERINLPKEKILHVAQSLFHDIVPAKKLGLSTVLVNRRHGKEGFGATPPAQGTPDLEVPDLKTLVSTIGISA